MSIRPKVSIVTISYNQEEFIRETLESFVFQKTNFQYEVVIADDASSDSTPNIIREFAKKYPDIFRPILRKKNIGAANNSVGAIRAAKGNYIALCEGDDYWTDPDKLQLQADFLDANSDYGLCFHPVKVFYQDNERPGYIYPDIQSEAQCTQTELLKWNFIQTNSVMYRRQNYDNLPTEVLPLDWYLHLYHAKFGKIGFINRVMSAYRRHVGGLWWDSEGDQEALLRRHGTKLLGLYIELLKLYGSQAEARLIINYRISNLFGKLSEIDKKYSENIIRHALSAYPDAVQPFLIFQVQELNNSQKSRLRQEQELAVIKQEISALKEEMTTMRQSKFWKLHDVYHRYKTIAKGQRSGPKD